MLARTDGFKCLSATAKPIKRVTLKLSADPKLKPNAPSATRSDEDDSDTDYQPLKRPRVEPESPSHQIFGPDGEENTEFTDNGQRLVRASFSSLPSTHLNDCRKRKGERNVQSRLIGQWMWCVIKVSNDLFSEKSQ
jgi:hypothetical protein